MKILNWKWILLGLVALLISAHEIEAWPTPEEKELRQELDNLPPHKAVPLSSLSAFKDYHTVCIVDSYAIHPPFENDSLSKIFGTIDYSRFRSQIIDKYSDYYGMGFFPVRDIKVVKWIRVGATPKAYIRPATISYEPRNIKYFEISGCHKSSDICLTSTVKDPYGYQLVEMNYCQPADPARDRFVFSRSNIESWHEDKSGVHIELTEQGKENLLLATRKNLHTKMDFYIGSMLVFSPMINEPIDSGKIDLSLDEKQKTASIPLLPPDKKENADAPPGTTYATPVLCGGFSSSIVSVCTKKLGTVFTSQKWIAAGPEINLMHNHFHVGEWACLPSKSGNKMVFYLGNSGNCDTCEGFEIWNPDRTNPSGLLHDLDFDAVSKDQGFPIKKGQSFWDQFQYVKCGLAVEAHTPLGTPSMDAADAVVAKFLSYDADRKEEGQGRGSAVVDLNGDGTPEIVLVWTAMGPTYWRNNLTVFSKTSARYEPVSSLVLNGEARLSSVKDGLIFVDQVTYAPGNPICCPTVKQRLSYRWLKNKLSEVK